MSIFNFLNFKLKFTTLLDINLKLTLIFMKTQSANLPHKLEMATAMTTTTIIIVTLMAVTVAVLASTKNGVQNVNAKLEFMLKSQIP